MKKRSDNNEQFSGYTESQEDFVEALLMLEEKGEPLETTRVAKLLNISKPAVHQMGHILIDRGLITREDYGDMYLTDAGRELAKKVLHRHRIIHSYLVSLGVNEETAEEDCCRIEHIISEETFQAFVKELEARKSK
ncbi:MAG: metal-dependent transcriptional regulator [Bacilli bacterium]|nr:metal-dependent transcriptional regulator [Bacilli bacterium]